MDNSSPLLNFVLGNVGLSEVDVQSVELLLEHLQLCMVPMLSTGYCL
jgi:hypothetical protein